jgi:hypothetical protein
LSYRSSTLAAARRRRRCCIPTWPLAYREQVTTLAAALQHIDSRSEAAEALRGFVDAIVLIPTGSERRIELKGNLVAMLSAAQNAKRSPEDDLALQVAVAGAGFDAAWRFAGRKLLQGA